jgi:putative oxidoreductase
MWMRLLQGPAGGGPAGFDLGMLVLRLGFGGFLAFGHGLEKALNYNALLGKGFPDPLGIGAAASLSGAMASELVFSILVMLGVFTRLSTLPVIFTMGMAAFVIHAGAPLFTKDGPPAREPALMYMIAFTAILFAGPGRFSVDGCVQPSNPSKPTP